MEDELVFAELQTPLSPPSLGLSASFKSFSQLSSCECDRTTCELRSCGAAGGWGGLRGATAGGATCASMWRLISDHSSRTSQQRQTSDGVMKNTVPISQPCSGGLSPAALINTMSPAVPTWLISPPAAEGHPHLPPHSACTQSPSWVPGPRTCLHLETLEAGGCMRGSSRWLRPSTSLTKRHPGSSASEQTAFQYYSNND